MKYFLRSSSGRRLEVEVEHDPPSTFRLRVDGRNLRADLVDVDRQGQYAACLDDRSFAAAIEQRDDQHLLVTLGGECFVIQATDEREQAAGALASTRPRAETVKASMPGIVVRVSVTAGEAVSAGQPLLVLEAMKMQNEVCAEHVGVVSTVEVSPGQAVAAGEIMLRLDPPAASRPAAPD